MKEFNYCILIIAFILAALQLNVYTNIVSSYLIFYVLSYSYFKNFNKAILYALFLLFFFIFLQIFMSYSEKYLGEHFESKSVDKFTKQEIEKLEENINKDIDDAKKEHTKNEKFAPIDKMSPAQAQRELYKLVDTSNLLKNTMEEMTPLLKEGKSLMKAFKQLNLTE